jgi:hypothetical protein
MRRSRAAAAGAPAPASGHTRMRQRGPHAETARCIRQKRRTGAPAQRSTSAEVHVARASQRKKARASRREPPGQRVRRCRSARAMSRWITGRRWGSGASRGAGSAEEPRLPPVEVPEKAGSGLRAGARPLEVSDIELRMDGGPAVDGARAMTHPVGFPGRRRFAVGAELAAAADPSTSPRCCRASRAARRQLIRRRR